MKNQDHCPRCQKSCDYALLRQQLSEGEHSLLSDNPGGPNCSFNQPCDLCIQATWQMCVERLSCILQNEHAFAELEEEEKEQNMKFHYRLSQEYPQTIETLRPLLRDYQEIARLVGKREEWRTLKMLVNNAADANFGLVLHGLHMCMLDVLELLPGVDVQTGPKGKEEV